MKTLHTDNRAEIILTIPAAESPKVTEAIAGILRLAGHELINESEIEDGKLYSIEEAFPDFTPAAILKGARLRCEWGQAELADKLCTTQSRVSELENGKRPISRKMAAKLGKLFNLPTKAFI
jgi:DNA-binding XRE family transcriptional regulator